MSSSKNGVQAKIAAEYPNAIYVHYRSHVLSLALSSSCKNVPEIRNLFDSVGRSLGFLEEVQREKKYFWKQQLEKQMIPI